MVFVYERRHSAALSTAAATPYLFRLLYSSSRRTEGRRRDRNGVEYRDKHRAGLLPKKSVCCGGPIRPCKEKVVHRSQARPLSGMVQPAQWAVIERRHWWRIACTRAGMLEHY